jgi:excisionase family DNA binding protein
MAEPFLTAEELAKMLGVTRSFVYEHAEELGGYRLGGGPRARLRFDLDEGRRRTSCYRSRESRSVDPARAAASRPRRHRRMGTSAPLLPIRGRSEAA